MKPKHQVLFVLAVVALLCNAGQVNAKSLTYGSGLPEIILFTDFFCPPCQKLESMIDKKLDSLVYNNTASVTFMPLPMSKHSMAAIAYFISIADGQPYNVVTQIRKNLYSMAGSGSVNDNIVNNWVNEYRGKTYISPYIQTMQNTVIKYKVRSTPTCVIRYANGRTQIFQGYQDIQAAINGLAITN